jgi:hypothetical protein
VVVGGGCWIGPSEFVVQAESFDAAFLELEKQEWFSTEYCECCGVRWSKHYTEVLNPTTGLWDFVF